MSVMIAESRGRWTVDRLRRLPEDEFHRYEIDDGVLIVSPRSASPRQAASLEIAIALREPARAAGLEVVQEVEVVTDRRDDWLKVADVVAVTWDAFDAEPQEYDAADVVLAVEISGSRQSRNRDFGEKLEAYAEAGIRHYWIAELLPPPRLTVFELRDGGYEQVASSETPIKLSRPFPVEIDPSRLRGSRRR